MATQAARLSAAFSTLRNSSEPAPKKRGSIPALQSHRSAPEGRQRKSEGEVGNWPVTLAHEAHLDRQRARQEAAEAVGKRRPAQVGPRPG